MSVEDVPGERSGAGTGLPKSNTLQEGGAIVGDREPRKELHDEGRALPLESFSSLAMQCQCHCHPACQS